MIPNTYPTLNFDLGETADMLRDSVKSFAQNEIAPLADEIDRTDVFPRQLLPKMGELGLLGITVEEEWGGTGLGYLEHCIAMEEVSRASASVGLSYGAHSNLCVNQLRRWGTDDQKTRYLSKLVTGEHLGALAMSETGAGSDVVSMKLRAEKKGDHYILNGHKWFTTGADGSTFAIVMCVTNPEEENPYLRASQLIVPLNTEGFVHERRIPIMGDEGEGWASHSEIRFENCRVPKENLLGGAGKGFVIAQERLGPGRIHHCMRWIGIAERAFEMMCARAATRKLGSNRLLAHQQTIQNWIAESRAEIHAARLMVLDAADKIDKEGAYKARVEISTIKFFTAKVMQDVVDRAIQVHGALGTTEDTILSFLFRHERGARIYDGADEVHKSRVAREILKPYGVKL